MSRMFFCTVAAHIPIAYHSFFHSPRCLWISFMSGINNVKKAMMSSSSICSGKLLNRSRSSSVRNWENDSLSGQAYLAFRAINHLELRVSITEGKMRQSVLVLGQYPIIEAYSYFFQLDLSPSILVLYRNKTVDIVTSCVTLWA